ILSCGLIVLSLSGALSVQAGAATYYSVDEISTAIFGTADVQNTAVWLNADRKAESADLFGSAFTQARFRYQYVDGTRLWLLNEIGKDKPISYAVATKGGKILRIEVMVFREARGDEIRLPQYTAQFQNISLTESGDLSEHIDGISGATYSVRSMKKVAKMALLLDRWASEDHAGTP
ncbi:MAG: FMN-binding protein, partial [Thalassolituus sp.]